LQVLPIGSEALVVGLPRTHRLTRRQRIRAADLADEPIVTGSAERAPGFYRMMFGQIWGEGAPRIVLHEPDEEHMLRAVAAGTGLTILTESRAKAIQVQGVAIRRFAAPEPRAGLALVWLAGNLNTALAMLVDAAHRFVSQRPA
jgi:DNA-binding transcriptional LysR family regulator